MNFAYKCKFCGTTGVSECDDECPEIKIEAWLPLLCCNRCGAYQQWLRGKLMAIATWSRDWALRSPKSREETRGNEHRKTEKWTREVADVMCKHHRVEFTWSDDFVNELLAHPEVSQTIVRSYESGLRWKARAGHAPEVYEANQ